MYVQILIRYYMYGPQTERAFVGPFEKREEAKEWREKYRPLQGELLYKKKPSNNSVYGPHTTQVEAHNLMWEAIHAVHHT
ncbi:MAG: hypothetical protein AAB638_03325 [Patescibacteria group bacterium]